MKPSCAQCLQLASALYDDALPLESRTALLEHLASCSSCRSEYRTLETALAALAGLGDTHTSPEFERRVVRHASAQLARERLLSWGRPVLLRRGRLIALAGVLVTLSLVSGIWLGGLGWPGRLGGSDSSRDSRTPAIQSDAMDKVENLVDDLRRGGGTQTVPPGPSAEELERLVATHLQSLGFVKKAEGGWLSPLEVRIETEGICVLDGEPITHDELMQRIMSTIPPITPEFAGPPGPTAEQLAEASAAGSSAPVSATELMDGVRAYLLEQGFVEKKGHWYSETESRLLEPGMACIAGRILTREKLKEELKPEILGDAGFVLNGDGQWVIKASPVTVVATNRGEPKALEAGDRFWAPEPVITELDGGDSRRVERSLRGLRTPTTRGAAARALADEGPRAMGALKAAYEAASAGASRSSDEERLALGRLLAWNGVETPEVVQWVEQIATYYQSAKPGKNRADRYHESVTALDEIGLMSGRILARIFGRQPTLRVAELLSNFRDPAAETFLLDVYLQRPGAGLAGAPPGGGAGLAGEPPGGGGGSAGAPESESQDLHDDFLNWWIDRRASGEPVIFDRAVALLNRSDERELLLGVHLLEAIAYRYPEWAERITAELLAAAESSFCGCTIPSPDAKAMSATFADCRLHEDVTVSEVKTSSIWLREADLTQRGRTRTLRGSAVAADIGRVLSNLTGVEHSLSFRGDHGGDLLMVRDRQKVSMHNWRLQYRQHRDEYVERWQKMAPGAAAFRDSELRAPWHLRNLLAGERTDLRATYFDPDLGFVGMRSVLSDRTTLKTVILRFFGRSRGGRIDPDAGTVLPVRSPEGLPSSLTTSIEFYALGIPLLDGLNLALEPRGLVVLFEEGDLYIGPSR